MKLEQYEAKVPEMKNAREIFQLLDLATSDRELGRDGYLKVLKITDERFGQLNGEVVPTTPRWGRS